jgi:diacylglycerol kinase (ATP)
LSAADGLPSGEGGGATARLVRSFGFAFGGLATLVRTQPNFRIHVVAAVLALVLGVVVRLSTAEMALIALTAGLVLVVEALNTCLETLCDLVSPTYHPLIKKCKDVSAAAVLISALAALGVAALLFLPRLR